MSSPSFVPERGEIWYSDGFQGFYAVRVTNDLWPFKRCGGQEASITAVVAKTPGTEARRRDPRPRGHRPGQGRAGRDRICGRGGRDRISGGPGRDRIDCGPGRDVAIAGPGDQVRRCETVR